MIQLNLDFSLLNKFFGISTSKVFEYSNKSLEEIMKLEAEQGNKKAENYQEILSDPQKIYEIFRLSNIENKFIILQNMSEEDLDDLLVHLDEKQLAVGLNFFTEEKLVQLAQNLPIETLAPMILEKFNLFDVLKFMDDDSMNTFLMQPDIERKYAQKYFESLDPQSLEKIMTEVYGPEEKGKGKTEYLDNLKGLKDDDFMNFMLRFERQSKMNLINGIVEQNPDYLLLFKNEDMVQPMKTLMKEDKVKLMESLDSEFLIPMIEELPANLEQIILTQIDPHEFSEIISEDFQDILLDVVLFSAS